MFIYINYFVFQRAIKLSQLESSQKQIKQNPAPEKQSHNPVQQKQNQQKNEQQISGIQKEKPMYNKVDNKAKVTMSVASNQNTTIKNTQPNQEIKIESANKEHTNLDMPLPADNNILTSSINEQSQLSNQSLISNNSLSNSNSVPIICVNNSNNVPTICVNNSNTFPINLQGKKAKLAPINPNKKGNVNQTNQVLENKSNKKEIPKQQMNIDHSSLEKRESQGKEFEIDKDKIFEEAGKTVTNQSREETKNQAKEVKTDLDMLLDEEKEPQEKKEAKYSSNEIKFYGFNPDIKQKEKKYYEELLHKEKEQQKIIAQLEECRDDLVKQKMEFRKKKEDEFIKKLP